MFHTIESDTPFDVVCLDFWEPGDSPDWDELCNIFTCLDFIKGFELGTVIELKEFTPDRVTQWDFGNLFVLFELPKWIVVDAHGIFLGFSRNIFRIP